MSLSELTSVQCHALLAVVREECEKCDRLAQEAYPEVRDYARQRYSILRQCEVHLAERLDALRHG